MTAPAPAPVVPRLRVDGPPAPQPHRFGLFSAATVLENVAPHALLGVEYETVCSTQVDPYPLACQPSTPPDADRVKKPARTTDVVATSPFAVYAADACALGRDQNTARAQLRQRFLAGEETAVEHAVFTGELGTNSNLVGEAVVLADGQALELVDALGALEAFLATSYGGVGLIHAPMQLAPRAQAQLLIGVAGPRATTVLGSTWVFGTGYPGTSPDAAGGGGDAALWLYATPPATVRRSALIEPADWDSGAFDRATNSGLLLEERIYVIDWPCRSAAIKTTLPRPPAPPAEPAPARNEES